MAKIYQKITVLLVVALLNGCAGPVVGVIQTSCHKKERVNGYINGMLVRRYVASEVVRFNLPSISTDFQLFYNDYDRDVLPAVNDGASLKQLSLLSAFHVRNGDGSVRC